MNIYWTLILVTFVFSAGFALGALWSKADWIEHDHEYRYDDSTPPKPPG